MSRLRSLASLRLRGRPYLHLARSRLPARAIMADRLAAVRNASSSGFRSPGPPSSRDLYERPGLADTATPRRASEPIIETRNETSATLDVIPQLLHSEHSVVKGRIGSVLSRGMLLKTDHYPTGRAMNLDINVHGAPNFRTPRRGRDLNVFGVAQPRTQGLRAILSILRARPGTPNPTRVIWFSAREEPVVYISGRPFVLRDASQPRVMLRLSDRAENLEAIEQRLKLDILAEAAKYGGLLLTHNEAGDSSIADGHAAIIPTWTAVDATNVKTSRELWGQMKEQGWNVDYHRIPITLDRGVEDSYLDAYLSVLSSTSPLESAVVFACGTGAVRTTFSMVAASIFRRKQLLAMGLPDPYDLPASTPSLSGLGIHSGTSTPSGTPVVTRLAQAMEQANVQQDMNRALLRLTYVLQKSLPAQSAVEILLAQPELLDTLRKAHMGNYGVILSLLGCLENGLKAKKLVDTAIDACDHVTNLREAILLSRIEYSMTTALNQEDDARREDVLDKAVRALEKYFYMIAFTSYVEEADVQSQSFSSWMKTRTEIANQITFLRKSFGSRLNVFAPVNDLSALSKTGSEERALVAGQQNDVAVLGGQILGDEYTEHVIRNRSGIILREGTLLKSDQWFQKSQHMANGVRGAINFRNIPETPIYALGQPTVDAIEEVVRRIRLDYPKAGKILWITLREEPLVYINGAPHCLRRERFTLRNIKDYGGISASRLEALEDRLGNDVQAELEAFGGRLLLHTETESGNVIPIWEDVPADGVASIRDIMSSRKRISPDFELQYTRIPITSERPPDFSDLSELMDVVMRSDSVDTPIVVNCQLGRGRSTLASILLILITEWIQKPRLRMWSSKQSPTRMPLERTVSTMSYDGTADKPIRPRRSYQIINNLLRVVQKGRMVKDIVDAAIDRCGEVENLRDSIEDCRLKAEQATTDVQRKEYTMMGLQNLRRYFQIILFQAYLQSTEPDVVRETESFETWVQNRPVIKTFEKELLTDSIMALRPLERIDPGNGEAAADEVKHLVANRRGIILSASTILKSDFFSNLQKMSLPDRVDGAPNFRRVPLTFSLDESGQGLPDLDGKKVCGSGMPTVDGLRHALERVDAGPDASNMAYWTSLREEPVIYVAGRPHVLRLVDKPLENVEATGVATTVVERMEERLKADVLKEVAEGHGRLLLHDEVEDHPGSFSIVPVWVENLTEEDILTPREVFKRIIEQGYRVDYSRVAITDEQAPLPEALSQLVDRVNSGLSTAGDFIFNCQMGRGRTTSGMVAASLIATTALPNWNHLPASPEAGFVVSDASEEEAYLQGEYKTILQLVGVLSHGKVAKLLVDRTIDLMQDVQNLRKAVYPYKLKVDASPKGSQQHRTLEHVGINYLYRYAALITFANWLIELRQNKEISRFPDWLVEHREISSLLSRTSLD